MRILIVTAVLVGIATVAVPAAPMLTAETAATVKALSGLSGQAFDAAFLRALIPVDEEAVEVSMAATLNADHSELLQWNQVLIDRKNGQVRQMLGWLKAMGASQGKRNAGVVSAPVKRMRSLKDAALEKAYLPMMASHLEQSRAIASVAASKASRPEIRAFAQRIVKVEVGESSMLRSWMKKWYGQ